MLVGLDCIAIAGIPSNADFAVHLLHGFIDPKLTAEYPGCAGNNACRRTPLGGDKAGG